MKTQFLRLLSLLGASTVNYNRRRSAILGTFTKAKNELEDLNHERSVYIAKLDTKINNMRIKKTFAQDALVEDIRIVQKLEDFCA